MVRKITKFRQRHRIWQFKTQLRYITESLSCRDSNFRIFSSYRVGGRVYRHDKTLGPKTAAKFLRSVRLWLFDSKMHGGSGTCSWGKLGSGIVSYLHWLVSFDYYSPMMIPPYPYDFFVWFAWYSTLSRSYLGTSVFPVRTLELDFLWHDIFSVVPSWHKSSQYESLRWSIENIFLDNMHLPTLGVGFFRGSLSSRWSLAPSIRCVGRVGIGVHCEHHCLPSLVSSRLVLLCWNTSIPIDNKID